MRTLYNEIDRFCCGWLSNLMDANLITPGKIDDRSISDLGPDDVAGFERVHFFAGIGGWDFALRLAGWAADRPIWTGSCPCQPLSGAGLRKGHADERHLWPAFHDLIAECEPSIVFGEQVASKDGREWLAAIRLDLEALGYACGAADLCAAGIGAPHIRQRLYWVADADCDRRDQGRRSQPETGNDGTFGNGSAYRMADSERYGLERRSAADVSGERWRDERRAAGCEGGAHAWTNARELGNANEPGSFPGAFGSLRRGEESPRPRDGESKRSSFWCDIEWIPCTDGKARPTKPGIFPLAHGFPNRVGILRGAGNAIVPKVAAEFISAFAECRP